MPWGDHDFGCVASLLDCNLDGIVSTLRDQGKLDDTYWICAFSVNQHHSICEAVQLCDIDSATQDSYSACDCGAPKYYNCCSPLRWDGKSISCEMNKFSDMMAFLAATDQDFEHVIAVDVNFRTFTRAWVVAEIAQGYGFGLRQHLKLRSARALHEHEAELRHLDMRQMRASRPEDTAEILAGIPDKDAFNRHLQSMIFDERTGLLAMWKGQDSAKQMERTGRLARLMLREPS